MKIKVNKPISDHKIGSVVEVETDKSGIPLDREWRRRLSDSKIDGCCEIVKSKEKK